MGIQFINDGAWDGASRTRWMAYISIKSMIRQAYHHNHRSYYTVVSHSHIISHHVEMAYLNTCVKSYSILFKWSSASIFPNRVPNWSHESLDVFRILFHFENLTLLYSGGFKETKLVKILTNLHLLQTKNGNNSVMHVGAIMIFGGILEGVWPINNQKKFPLCYWPLYNITYAIIICRTDEGDSCGDCNNSVILIGLLQIHFVYNSIRWGMKFLSFSCSVW